MNTSNTTVNKSELDNVIFNYSASVTQLEEENKLLRETLTNLKGELDRFKRPPLMICELMELLKDKAIVRVPNGNLFLVEIAATAKDLHAGDSVVCEQRNLTIIEKVNNTKKFNVEQYVIVEKPNVNWSQLGGLSTQILEIKEVIELPIKKPQLFKKIGITPPKGVLLYGPPGTGKTLLAKAVAASSNSTFIEIVGSELVQKFIGEGAKLVKEVFELAREKAPSIVFIDEIDALASKRIDIGTSGEREVQRTFMQLLAEIDGFKQLGNVKIIGCTNRKDILDPAILRPGRLDRLIYVPTPNDDGIREIFKIHSKNMPLDKTVRIDKLIKSFKGFSGAEIKAVCTEAGYFAIRKEKNKVSIEDFQKAVEKVKQNEENFGTDYLHMFG